MLMFIVWCLVTLANLDCVVADTVGVDTCNSGYELHRRMDWVSSSLKLKAPYSNQNWTTAFQTLQDSQFVTPPEFSKKLKNLKDAATQYNDFLSLFYVHATTIEADSTYNRMYSDYKMVNYIDCDQSYFNGTKLVAACAVVDETQKYIINYTNETNEIFHRFQLTLLPHNSEIIDKMNGLLTILKSGTNIDYDAIAMNVSELTQLIRNDTAHLRENVVAELVKFGTVVDELACEVDILMQTPAKALYDLLPDKCHLSLDPACDSPQHLLKRALGMVDALNNIQLIVDSVPSQVAHQLKSSTLWTSERLQNSLKTTKMTTERIIGFIDDMVAKSQMQLKKVTDGHVLSDFKFIQEIEEHQEGFLNNSNLLSLACELGDAGRNITAAYNSSISLLVQRTLEPEKWNGMLEMWGNLLRAIGRGSEGEEKVNELMAEGMRGDKLDLNDAGLKREMKFNEIIIKGTGGNEKLNELERKLHQTFPGDNLKEKLNEITDAAGDKGNLKQIGAEAELPEQLQKMTSDGQAVIDHMMAVVGEQLGAMKNQQIVIEGGELIEPGAGIVRGGKFDQNDSEDKTEEKINKIVGGAEGIEKLNDHVQKLQQTDPRKEKFNEIIGAAEVIEKLNEPGAGGAREEKLQKIVFDHISAMFEGRLAAFKSEQAAMAKKANAEIQILTEKLKEIVSSHILIHDE